jgi:hypothetical protein
MVSSSVAPVPSGQRVDANALRTNQAAIVAITVLAFVLGSEIGAWLVAALAVSLAIGSASPGNGPIQLLYRHLLRPAGLIKPSPRPDDPAPHRFAQAMGAGVLALAAILLFAGATIIGWTLAWLVVALALTNLVFGFCAGCFIFLQLRKAGFGR